MSDIFENKKEVYYDKWCSMCKHKHLNGVEDPCNECLAQGWNVDSHKPINFNMSYAMYNETLKDKE